VKKFAIELSQNSAFPRRLSARQRKLILPRCLVAIMQMPVIPDSAVHSSRFRRDAYICVFLALVTLALYWPVIGFEFNNYDDAQYITDNSQIHSGLTGQNVLWAFTTGHASNWHPLTWLSHLLDCQLYGLNPAGHHFTNLLYHVANTLLLFGLLRRMTGAVWRAAFVSALFALHPLHVESVAWIAERKDVLSAFFGLLTLWAWLTFIKAPSPWRYALALLLFTLALMSKPMLVSLPFLMLLLDFWPLRRVQPEKPLLGYATLVKEKIPFFALTLISCIVTFLVQKAGGAVVLANMISPEKRAANAVVSYLRYILKLLWPQNMAVIYPYPAHIPWWQVAGACGLLVAISIAVLRTASRRPYLIVGWLWFIISLVPVIGLVQVGVQSIADRYTYLPAIGLFVMVAWEATERLAAWPPAKPMLASAAGVVLAGCFLVSMHQLQYWHDSIALFTHAIEVTTGNAVAHCNLGQALAAAGKPEQARDEYTRALTIDPNYVSAMVSMSSYYNLHRNYDEAISCLNAALTIRPDSDQAHYNLALAFSGQGKTAQAVAEYRAALKINPRHDKALVNLGATLAQQGDLTNAISLYQRALEIAPDNPYAHNALGGALESQGKLDDAVRQYSAALQIQPNLVEAHENLAVLLAGHGHFDDARSNFEAAIKLRPNDPALHLEFANTSFAAGDLDTAVTEYSNALKLQPGNLAAHYNLATALARQGQWDAALAHFSEVLRLKPGFADAHASMAIIMAQQGNYRGAIEHYRAALQLNPNLVTVQKYLAWLLATAPDAGLRDGPEAVRLATGATQLAASDPTAWDALAAARAEAGNFPDAVTAANKAIELADAGKQTELAAKLRDRLKLYQAGQPFHAPPPAAPR
jgi:tetratricopeptide (TPR) repeat protein